MSAHELEPVHAAQIVDLIKRSDRDEAIALLLSALAVARSAGVVQGTVDAFDRADAVLEEFQLKGSAA